MTLELIITLALVVGSNIAGWIVSYTRSKENIVKECAVLNAEVQNIKAILSNGLPEKLEETTEAVSAIKPQLQYLMDCKMREAG